jgi:hypothetical protein
MSQRWNQEEQTKHKKTQDRMGHFWKIQMTQMVQTDPQSWTLPTTLHSLKPLIVVDKHTKQAHQTVR